VLNRKKSRAAGLLAGQLADLAFADPACGHPVAGFGWVASTFERVGYQDSRAAGVRHTGLLLGVLAAGGVALQRWANTRRTYSGPALAVVTAVSCWVSLGGTSLVRTGNQLAGLLATGQIDEARELLPALCGRDPATLDVDGLARAALESVAENTSDAHVAPLFWAAVGGVPAALVYRGINTLDAMIGHRSPRYARFGWAAARLDDIANFIPARLTAALVVVCAPLVGGSLTGACRAWRRDADKHPSPNAGVVEAAFAGALGVRLGGPTQYHHQLEIRPTLGDGWKPNVDDLRRAVRLSKVVQVAAAIAAVRLSRDSGSPVEPR
jgi:adenosylcobinamide-phosphate synthase